MTPDDIGAVNADHTLTSPLANQVRTQQTRINQLERDVTTLFRLFYVAIALVLFQGLAILSLTFH